MAKTIELTQNKYVLVDDEDYEYLIQFNWYAIKQKKHWYAVRNDNIRMHREILKAPNNKVVDHINGDGLDNTKENLRICDKIENCRNRVNNKNNTSGYKGVHWHKQHEKWIAKIKFNYKYKHLGLFKNKEDAARAYNEAAIKYHKEFAKLNKIR